VGGRKYLLPDFKGFELEFQCLLMVAQSAVGTAHIVVGDSQIRVGGRKYLFPDFKGLELVFQFLLMLAQLTIGSAHIVVGGSPIRVVGWKYLLLDFKGFELVFQCLLMLAQIAVGRAEVVVRCRQLGGSRGILLQKLHRPVIAVQCPPELHQDKPKISRVANPYGICLPQHLRGGLEDGGDLGKFHWLIGCLAILSTEPLEKNTTIFHPGGQLLDADQADDRVDAQEVDLPVQPAAICQILQKVGHPGQLYRLSRFRPFFKSLGKEAPILRRLGEQPGIQTAVGKQRGIAQHCLLRLRHFRDPEDRLQMLIDPRLRRCPGIGCSHHAELRMLQIPLVQCLQQRPAGIRPALPAQQSRHQIHGQGMSPDGGDQGIHVLPAYPCAVLVKDGMEALVVHGRDFRCAPDIVPGGDQNPDIQLAEFLPEPVVALLHPIRIVQDQQFIGTAVFQNCHDLGIDFPDLPVLPFEAVDAVGKAIDHRLGPVPAERDEIGSAKPVVSAEADGKLRLAHAAQSRQDHHMLPPVEAAGDQLQLLLTTHKAPVLQRGGQRQPQALLPLGQVHPLPEVGLNPAQLPLRQAADLPHQSRQIPDIPLRLEIKALGHLRGGFEALRSADHHDDQPPESILEFMLEELVQSMAHLFPGSRGGHLDSQLFSVVTQVNGRKILLFQIHVLQVAVQNDVQQPLH